MDNSIYQRIFETGGACLLMRVREEVITVCAVSNKYLQLTGTTAGDLVGKDPFDIFPDVPDDPYGATVTRNAILEAAQTGRQVKIPDYLYHIKDPETGILRPFWWTSIFDPIFDDNGAVIYVLGTAIDNTAEHLLEQGMNDAQQMLKLTITAAEIGTWSINYTNRQIRLSSRAKELLGLRTEQSTLEAVVDRIHPDYRQQLQKMIRDAVHSKGSKRFFAEYPLVNNSTKGERWLRSTGKLFPNVSGDDLVCGTVMDVTETKINEKKRSDFISMVSHDLKTPLTALTGYLDLSIRALKEDVTSSAEEYLAKARKVVTKMTTMISEFLDASVLEKGKLKFNKQKFELGELIQEVVEDALPHASGHPIIVHESPKVDILADRNKIGQVLFNLVSNAIKYSLNQAGIDIYCQIVDNDVSVHVIDQGKGIPMSQQGKLFKMFSRVEDSTTVPGYGIGLYLASEIIRHHGGNIGLTSEEGKGSDFYFTLPIAH